MGSNGHALRLMLQTGALRRRNYGSSERATPPRTSKRSVKGRATTVTAGGGQGVAAGQSEDWKRMRTRQGGLVRGELGGHTQSSTRSFGPFPGNWTNHALILFTDYGKVSRLKAEGVSGVNGVCSLGSGTHAVLHLMHEEQINYKIRAKLADEDDEEFAIMERERFSKLAYQLYDEGVIDHVPVCLLECCFPHHHAKIYWAARDVRGFPLRAPYVAAPTVTKAVDARQACERMETPKLGIATRNKMGRMGPTKTWLANTKGVQREKCNASREQD